MSVIQLARSYTCVQGAPVIHAVDTAIFELRYFARCMDCGFCNDQCCSYGVDIDLGNVMRLAALGEEFSSRIAAPRSEWFTGEVMQDPEFPTGSYVRTQERDGRCVFRNPAGRGCAIHGYALEKGIDYHDLKPMVSTLFPVTFNYGVLEASSEVHDKSLACAGTGPSIYDGARDELRYYFGDALVAELDAMAMKAAA
jgi:Fe-S-cluster containining protein